MTRAILTFAIALACAVPSVQPRPALQVLHAHAPDRTLPKWDDTWSDGCSVPPALKVFFPAVREEIRFPCVTHDECYYYGGSRARRLTCDYFLGIAWLNAGVPPEKVEAGINAIRVGGQPFHRVKGVSWAFGGEYFRYTAEPAHPP